MAFSVSQLDCGGCPSIKEFISHTQTPHEANGGPLEFAGTPHHPQPRDGAGSPDIFDLLDLYSASTIPTIEMYVSKNSFQAG